jgi:hypothetical protein
MADNKKNKKEAKGIYRLRKRLNLYNADNYILII